MSFASEFSDLFFNTATIKRKTSTQGSKLQEIPVYTNYLTGIKGTLQGLSGDAQKEVNGRLEIDASHIFITTQVYALHNGDVLVDEDNVQYTIKHFDNEGGSNASFGICFTIYLKLIIE